MKKKKEQKKKKITKKLSRQYFVNIFGFIEKEIDPATLQSLLLPDYFQHD